MKKGIVCTYIHDNSDSESNKAIYVPDTVFLNQSIKKWFDEGIDFCGIVHSHPVGQESLSSGDLEYIKMLYKMNPGLGKTFFPLVVNGCDMIVYAIERRDNEIVVAKESIETIL